MLTPSHSLKTKLIALTVGLSTVTAGLLGSYLVWNSYASLVTQAQQAQLALSRSLAAQLDLGLSEAFEQTFKLARRSSMAIQDRRQIGRELSLVVNGTELLDAMQRLSPSGELLAESYPFLNNVGAPPASLYRDAMPGLRALSQTVKVMIFRSRRGDPVAIMLASVHRDGDFTGAVSGLLNLTGHGLADLEHAGIGKTGYAFLADTAGRPLTGPGQGRIEQDHFGEEQEKNIAHMKEGVIQFKNAGGEQVLAAFSKVESAGWSVVVRQSAQECYAPAVRMLKVMTGLLLLALLLSAAIAAWLAGRMVQPVLTLTSQVRQLEEGRLPAEALLRGAAADELGLLATELATLWQRLRLSRIHREREHGRALDAERKLSESERLAMVGQLAAGLAHELNNPLTVIQGAAQMISKGRHAAKEPWVEEILRETRRCKRLVRDLLLFSKPIELSLAQVSLRLLCLEAWEQARMKRHGSCRLELPKADLRCQADSERMKQVFINLFSNALDATGGKGWVRLRWGRKAGQVGVEVSDSGSGFNVDEPETLFRPFYTTKAGGTGLGLSISRSVLQAHGGKLAALKRRGNGAVLSLQWPDSKGKTHA